MHKMASTVLNQALPKYCNHGSAPCVRHQIWKGKDLEMAGKDGVKWEMAAMAED